MFYCFFYYNNFFDYNNFNLSTRAWYI